MIYMYHPSKLSKICRKQTCPKHFINVIHPLKIPWSFVQRSILQSEYMNRSFITRYTKKCWIMTEVNAATETHTNLLLVLWGSRKACDFKLDIFQGLEEYFRDLRFDQKTVRDWENARYLNGKKEFYIYLGSGIRQNLNTGCGIFFAWMSEIICLSDKCESTRRSLSAVCFQIKL